MTTHSIISNGSGIIYYQYRRSSRPVQVRSVMIVLVAAMMCVQQLLQSSTTTTSTNMYTVEAFSMVQSTTRRVQQSSLHMSSITSPSSSTSNERRDVRTESITAPTTSTTTTGTTTTSMGTNMYMKNMVQSRWMELPASSLLPVRKNRDQQEQLQVMEQMIGRIAMMGAIGILLRECYDGQSIVDQVMNIV